MATSYKIAQPEIIFQDVFKLKEVYELIHDWLNDEKYLDKRGGDQFMEKYYHERRIQNVGKEIRIWWRTFKNPTKYFQYKLDVDFFVIAMKDVDVVKDGKKERANHGELQIKITGTLVVDPKNMLTDSVILRPFHWIFERVWMKQERDYHYAYLLKKVNQLEGEVKTHLKITNFMPQFKPYRPQY
ncbi:hypothetical protein COV93_06820 [Candidatus Woesearchaeota archaeon CG11_big_fil_rev_8_21_14_0_20_43_8]|nr:MAG: hypothetical protein COV93_06820 [Candidatus Woesearchaeota archaeon CG11_big_fil_rev_8_21_14_0_20_43_8]PIO05190.1 MAG: hypothetical protein COT47_05750 [Candidatus Woesearchaeota archaeon CG08_land_8_20_14_0_20_43_7]